MERYPIRTTLSGSRTPKSADGRKLATAVAAIACTLVAAPAADAQQPNAGGRTVRPQVQLPQQGPPAGQPPGAAPAPAAHSDLPVPNAPFELTPEQQLQLDSVLNEWEQHSEKVEVFRCDVIRWEHDPIFGKDREAIGELKYRAPDRGLYRVKDKATGEWIEDWRCDGKAIYEFNFQKKQLIERTLPRELQGKAIANGPLPFIFSAKAVTLKQRYFLRLVAPPENLEKMLKTRMICIEAFPRFQADAANFRRAEIMLMRDSMLPYALRLEMPNGKSTTDHVFQNVKTNNALDIVLSEFDAPRTPLIGGWKRIVDPEGPPQPPQENHATTVPAAQAPQQATRPASGERR